MGFYHKMGNHSFVYDFVEQDVVLLELYLAYVKKW